MRRHVGMGGVEGLSDPLTFADTKVGPFSASVSATKCINHNMKLTVALPTSAAKLPDDEQHNRVYLFRVRRRIEDDGSHVLQTINTQNPTQKPRRIT